MARNIELLDPKFGVEWRDRNRKWRIKKILKYLNDEELVPSSIEELQKVKLILDHLRQYNEDSNKAFNFNWTIDKINALISNVLGNVVRTKDIAGTIIHYTSHKNWKLIKESGFLLAKTRPNEASDIVKLSPRVSSIVQNDAYLVGIPGGAEDNWKKYKMMESLRGHTGGEVILRVQILNPSMSFVRDHIYFSDKRLIDKYGEEFYKNMGKLPDDDPRIIKEAQLYLESTIPLNEYKGNYSVPEIWLAQTTPIDKLTKL
ncbi:MAG: hypothetical protein KAQ83_01530 [Nanoarchaeota archaeon]|nr:hypothetical protein [Nanoarchaeota archaeon]